MPSFQTEPPGHEDKSSLLKTVQDEPSRAQKKKSCALSIISAVTDVAFLETMVNHISRFCGSHDFSERVLFLDTAPLTGVYSTRPGIGTMDQLLTIADRLKKNGLIDRISPITYERMAVKAAYIKHFGRDLRFTHEFRGYPIYGSIFGIEDCAGDYVLHFDSDILGYSQQEDWVSRLIDLYEVCPDILFIAPRSGPPSPDGTLKQRGVSYTVDPRGFYAFNHFTSRKFLVGKDRLAKHLPAKPLYVSWKRRLVSRFLNKSALWNWEMMMSTLLHDRNLLRADVFSDVPWCLHTPDHGPQFIASLPDLVAEVEQGRFPAGQEGNYDLDLDLWLPWLSGDANTSADHQPTSAEALAPTGVA